ncbi:glycosyltransferase family 2 protein [Methylotetracoccus oryzae]|uniref:glycosyltransferase family 2 protein n=1 Tax=Methylotetracoccus oryzae TaxID=1919059 RepID=UPI0011190358|nr:glycosyltransferase family 2 protein [Methylotetracoccus oryzae]
MLDHIRRITELGWRKKDTRDEADPIPDSLRRNVRGTFVGALERMTGDLALEGWVVNLSDPPRPVDLWVVINGRKSRKARTELARIDVQNVIDGAGACGFRVSVSHHFDLSKPNEPVTLAVFLDESLELEMPGSPLKVDLSSAQTPEGLLDKLGDLAREGFHRFSPSNPFVGFFLACLGSPDSEQRRALLKECALSGNLMELMLLHIVQRGWYDIARRMLEDCRDLDGVEDEGQLNLLTQVIVYKQAVHAAELAHLIRPDLNELTLQIGLLVTAPLSEHTKDTLCADYLRLVEAAHGRGFLGRQQCQFLGAQLDNLASKHRQLEKNVQYLCVKANLARDAGQNNRAYTLFSEAYRIDEGAALWFGPKFSVLLNEVGEYGYAASLFKKLWERRIASPELVSEAFSGAVTLEDYEAVLGVIRRYSRLLFSSRSAENILMAIEALCRNARFRGAFFSVYGERVFALLDRQRLLEELEVCFERSGTVFGKGGAIWPGFDREKNKRRFTGAPIPSELISSLLLLDDLDLHRLIGAVDDADCVPGQFPRFGATSCREMSWQSEAAIATIYWPGAEKNEFSRAQVRGGQVTESYSMVLIDPCGIEREPELRRFRSGEMGQMPPARCVLVSDYGVIEATDGRELFRWPERIDGDALVRIMEVIEDLGTKRFLFVDKDRYILNHDAITGLIAQLEEFPIELEGSTTDGPTPDSSLLLPVETLREIRAHFASRMFRDEREGSMQHQWHGNAEEFLSSLVCFARRLGSRRISRNVTTTYIRDCDAPAEMTREMDKLRCDMTLHNVQLAFADIPRNAEHSLVSFSQGRFSRAEVLNVRGVGLLRLKGAKIEIARGEPVCFIVERNELLRLPYLLTFYRGCGIRRFVVIDNYSAPETLDFLASHDDVELWVTQHPYGLSRWGVDWVEAVIETFYSGHWCLVIDADELLYTAGDSDSIPALCDALEREGASGLYCLFLDTYSDRSIADTVYQSGTSFLDCCNYIDRKFYTYYEPNGGPEKNSPTYSGGVRERVFGISTVILNKVPLFKYSRHLRLYEGLHWIGGVKLSSQRGALLHFKYFSTFHEYVAQESLRGEHWNEGSEYKIYQQVIARNRGLTLHDPRISAKVTGVSDLRALHLIK